MTERYDALVIGAGHNGLVCAGYLAKAGLKVLVCEAAGHAGGMAAAREFGRGYRVPSLAHVHYPPGRKLCADLRLDDFGYRAADPVETIALDARSGPLTIGNAAVHGAGLDAGDAAAWPDFIARYRAFAETLAPLFETMPPRLKNMAAVDRSALAKLALKARFGLGRDAMYEFLRVAGMNIYDVLDEAFGDERIKGAVALDAVLGSAMGPRTPGTVLTWLARLYGEREGSTALANGTLVPALERALAAHGAELRFDTPVERIEVEGDRATGAVLSGGETVAAGIVVSAIDPRKTFLELVGARRLDAMFAQRVAQIRGAGVVGKLHLGLSELPEFPGLTPAQLRQRLLVAPSMRFVERAFNASKYGGVSERPVFEVTIPSLADPALAPDGHQVLSVSVAYLPYRLDGGWDDRKPEIFGQLMAELAAHAPGIESLVTDHEFLTPADIEEQYGAVEGHWHHGELSLHQSFMLRPVYGAAQYDTPLERLYLCSAGCHPGGGVTGLPGRNAAQRILASGTTG